MSDWRVEAACQAYPDLFARTQSDPTASDTVTAVAVCKACPVNVECADWIARWDRDNPSDPVLGIIAGKHHMVRYGVPCSPCHRSNRLTCRHRSKARRPVNVLLNVMPSDWTSLEELVEVTGLDGRGVAQAARQLTRAGAFESRRKPYPAWRAAV